MFLDFIYWLVERDRSKWYTFSKLDYLLLTYTGFRHYVTNGEDSCIGLWIFIIVMNILATYFYNKDSQ